MYGQILQYLYIFTVFLLTQVEILFDSQGHYSNHSSCTDALSDTLHYVSQTYNWTGNGTINLEEDTKDLQGPSTRSCIFTAKTDKNN